MLLKIGITCVVVGFVIGRVIVAHMTPTQAYLIKNKMVDHAGYPFGVDVASIIGALLYLASGVTLLAWLWNS